MAMVNNRRRNVPGTPTQKARAHAEIGIVAECEKRLVEASRFFENLPVIQRGAGVGPENFLGAIVLSDVCFHGAAATVLAIPVNQMANLVDHVRRVLEKNLAR